MLRRCHEAGASGTPGPGLPSVMAFVLWPASRVRGMARTKADWLDPPCVEPLGLWDL